MKPAAAPVVPSAPINWKMGAWILGATLLAYGPSFGGDFIWNDSDYVTAPQLRSLAGFWDIWFKVGATEQYYPLLHSFFWVQWSLWGDHPLGYHLVTVLLHAGAAVLFAGVLRRLFDLKAPEVAVARKPGKTVKVEVEPSLYPSAEWLAALIFALHPVHVESVAWITEQKNTLSLVFYLGAALLYLRFVETRRAKTYVAALACFVISLLCKTVTASLPVALLVALWWRRGRIDVRREVQPLMPWLSFGAVFGLFASWVEQHHLGAKGQDFDLPLLERGLVAGRAIWFYLGNLVWPVDLNFIYPRWVPDRSVAWQWLFPLGAVGGLIALWRIRRWSRAPLAAYLFFIVSLFPVLGFVNLYGALYSFVWDHWQYLPDLGPIALAAVAATMAWTRFAPRLQGKGTIVAAALAVVLGAITWEHCGMFLDDTTLYRETLRRNPTAWMAHFNQGGMFLKIPGKEAEAIAEFEAALRINPNLADAHYDLGTVLARLPGREAEAAAHFEAALRLTPESGAIHFNFANLLMKMRGRQPDAIAQYREAVRINPQLADAHYNLGLALMDDPQQIPEAIGHFQTALKTKNFPLAREIVEKWNSMQRRN